MLNAGACFLLQWRELGFKSSAADINAVLNGMHGLLSTQQHWLGMCKLFSEQALPQKRDQRPSNPHEYRFLRGKAFAPIVLPYLPRALEIDSCRCLALDIPLSAWRLM